MSDYADRIAERLWVGNPAVLTEEELRRILARAAREGYSLASGVKS